MFVTARREEERWGVGLRCQFIDMRPIQDLLLEVSPHERLLSGCREAAELRQILRSVLFPRAGFLLLQAAV